MATAALGGTLGSVTDSLAVEIAGNVYPAVDNMDGTWKVAGARLAGLPSGTYDVKVTAKNSIGIVRTDSTTDELKRFVSQAPDGEFLDAKSGIGSRMDMDNATYQQRYAARWQKLRKGQFSVENIARIIDDDARTLGDAAKRNERRWKEIAGTDSGQLTFTKDLKQMKEWVAARAQWLDAEIGRRTSR